MHHIVDIACIKESATQKQHETLSLDKKLPIDKTGGITVALHIRKGMSHLGPGFRDMQCHPFTNRIMVQHNSLNLQHDSVNLTHTASDLE
jgi:hypothetical protein